MSLRADLTLRQSLDELRRLPPKDEDGRRLIQQLARETSGPHDFLVLDQRGGLKKVNPDRTTLGDIAVPREVRTRAASRRCPRRRSRSRAYAPVGLVS